MKKILQTMLVSAVLATSSWASETLSGTENQNGDYELKKDFTIDTIGRLNMQSGSIKIDAEKILINKGTIDVSAITDFSGYVGKVTGASGSSLVIPKPSFAGTAGDKSSFDCDGEYKLTYDTGATAALTVDTSSINIMQTEGILYADTNAATNTLGLKFVGTATMDPQGSSTMTMDEVIAHKGNKAANQDKTFDIGQTGLSSPDVDLTGNTTIHFGLVGSSKDMTVTGAHGLTINGDCSGMTKKISAEGDVEFGDVGSSGPLEIQGKLNYTGSKETTITGDVKVGSFSIATNTTVTINGPITIGWKPDMFFDSTIMTVNNKIGNLTYTIYNNKVYTSDGTDGALMSKIDGAVIKEIPTAPSSSQLGMVTFEPRPGVGQLNLGNSSDGRKLIYSNDKSDFLGIKEIFDEFSNYLFSWDEETGNSLALSTDYFLNNEYIVSNENIFYTPLTRMDLRHTASGGKKFSCIFKKQNIYYLYFINDLNPGVPVDSGWYRQGTELPSLTKYTFNNYDGSDWTLTDEAWNAAVEDLGLVLQLKK